MAIPPAKIRSMGPRTQQMDMRWKEVGSQVPRSRGLPTHAAEIWLYMYHGPCQTSAYSYVSMPRRSLRLAAIVLSGVLRQRGRLDQGPRHGR